MMNSVMGLKGDLLGRVVTVEDGDLSITGEPTSFSVSLQRVPLTFDGSYARLDYTVTVGVGNNWNVEVNPSALVTWEEE